MNRYLLVVFCCLVVASCFPNELEDRSKESKEHRHSKECSRHRRSSERDSDSHSSHDRNRHQSTTPAPRPVPTTPQPPPPPPTPVDPLVASCQSLYPNSSIVQVKDSSCFNCYYVCFDNKGRNYLLPKGDGQTCGTNSLCFSGRCYESNAEAESSCQRLFRSTSDVIAIRNRDEPCRVYCGKNGENRLEQTYMPLNTICNTADNRLGYCGPDALCHATNYNYSK